MRRSVLVLACLLSACGSAKPKPAEPSRVRTLDVAGHYTVEYVRDFATGAIGNYPLIRIYDSETNVACYFLRDAMSCVVAPVEEGK